MSSIPHEAAEQHEGRSVFFYTTLAVFLAIVTFIELGPLFEWFELSPSVLIVLSSIKFAVVVAYFMHLADDAPIFNRVFVIPLFLAITMVVVLMAMAHTFFPSPKEDPFAVQERYYENWNSECNSWLRSSISNRVYCASPPIDRQRLALHSAGAGVSSEGPPPVDMSSMSDDARLATLRERGEQLYEQNCATCHQADGSGVGTTYPPLANSDYIHDKGVHIDVVLNGLSGPITVNGQNYNGVMAGFDMLNDFNVAAIVTYERTSWGNDLGMVLPEEVAARR